MDVLHKNWFHPRFELLMLQVSATVNLAYVLGNFTKFVNQPLSVDFCKDSSLIVIPVMKKGDKNLSYNTTNNINMLGLT